MEPIISPWTIYFINLVPNIGQMLCNIFVVCGLIAVCAIIICGMTTDDSWETKEQHQRNAEIRASCIKVVKITLPISLISVLILTFIPSKETLIAMLISSYITPDNLHGTNEVIKANLQDYINIIVDGINKVK